MTDEKEISEYRADLIFPGAMRYLEPSTTCDQAEDPEVIVNVLTEKDIAFLSAMLGKPDRVDRLLDLMLDVAFVTGELFLIYMLIRSVT